MGGALNWQAERRACMPKRNCIMEGSKFKEYSQITQDWYLGCTWASRTKIMLPVAKVLQTDSCGSRISHAVVSYCVEAFRR